MGARFTLFWSHGYGLVRSLLWAADLGQGAVLNEITCFRNANGRCLGLKVISPDQRARHLWALIGRGCGQQVPLPVAARARTKPLMMNGSR